MDPRYLVRGQGQREDHDGSPREGPNSPGELGPHGRQARRREAREHREPRPFDDSGDHRGGKGEARARQHDGTAATEDRHSQGHPEEQVGEGVCG